MYKITRKKVLAPGVVEMALHAPRVAKAHKPGQFLMVMNREDSERVPLTIADSDPGKGEVTIVFLEVGRSTIELGEEFNEGDEIFAVVGPLGTPTHVEKFGTVVVMGGGLGVGPQRDLGVALEPRPQRRTAGHVRFVAREGRLHVPRSEFDRVPERVELRSDGLGDDSGAEDSDVHGQLLV